MRFDNVLLIGGGKIATDCTRILKETGVEKLEVIESSDSQFSMLKAICRKNDVPYRCLLGKKEIREALEKKAGKGKLLIISANNRYLFPAKLCEKDNVEIINFHYGYLPRYRGMNIPTWTIYNNEPYTGVTWHYVTSEVDRGMIIAQEKIELDEKSTAYKVVCDGMRIGVALFKGFIGEFLENRIEGIPITTGEHIYLDRALPQNGVLELKNGIVDCDRLLRSFDYGRAAMIKSLEIQLNGKRYTVQSYSLEKGDRNEDSVTISCDGVTLKIQVKKLDVD